MWKSKGKTCMVEEPSHVKQLSLNHVCKIGLNRPLLKHHVWGLFSLPQKQTESCLCITEDPAFSASYEFSPSPSPPPSPPSLSSTGDTQEYWERETTCLRGGGGGGEKEPNQTTAKKLLLYNALNALWKQGSGQASCRILLLNWDTAKKDLRNLRKNKLNILLF